MTDHADQFNDRVKEFTSGALAALAAERRAECALLAGVEPGMRLRPCEDDPGAVELLWGGAVIGMTTWAWLNSGETSEGPGEYHGF